MLLCVFLHSRHVCVSLAIDSREQGMAAILYCCIILYCVYWLCIRVRTDTLLSVIMWFLARLLKKRLGEEETDVEEQTTRGRSQSTANPQKDSSRSLKGYGVIVCWKKQTHIHIKALQGSIIDYLPCNRTYCTSTANDIACMLKGLKEQYCAVPVACL